MALHSGNRGDVQFSALRGIRRAGISMPTINHAEQLDKRRRGWANSIIRAANKARNERYGESTEEGQVNMLEKFLTFLNGLTPEERSTIENDIDAELESKRNK
jgi:hypothetical protein